MQTLIFIASQIPGVKVKIQQMVENNEKSTGHIHWEIWENDCYCAVLMARGLMDNVFVFLSSY